MNLLDRIAQLKKLLEDCDDLRCQVFMDDQLAAADLAVEADVVYVDSAQLPGSSRQPGRDLGPKSAAVAD